MTTEIDKIAKKWQDKWAKENIFEAKPDNRKKFFVNLAYPYVNGYPHLGHLFSSIRVDVMARYKRLKGFNVLYPQGFHATGQPIIAAAELVKEKDKKQIDILLKMGIPKSDISKFEDPKHWIEFFSEKWREDLDSSGSSVDKRRSFITTEINPSYDKFIRWQYNILQEKGYVVKGSHPVVWCPKAKQPIGDHDRKEGEGVTPDEVTLVKFKDDKGRIFPAMTFRPETVFGVTNMWINPKGEYIEVKIKDKETWVVSKDALESLKMQNFKPEVKGEVKGKDLISIELTNPVNDSKIKTYEASFVNMENGTGVVMSVPAHAPLDYLALRDLGLENEIELIDLIKVDGFKKFPAKEIVEKMKVKDQNDPLSKEATKEIYKKEFHTGILNEKLGKYEGKSVSEVKDELIGEFIDKGIAEKYYTLAEVVISRRNARAVVAIVENQYFLNYSNPNWKKLAHECVSKMNFYPADTKQNYDYTIDWLKDWACARDKGIGTRLPWDENWIIEALSDSTIYMAYYTIAHYMEHSEKYNFEIENIKDSFFDYVFLGKGKLENVSKENSIDLKLIEQMRKEFSYWYKGGYDFRSSGKDLIQNHLTFSIFHHVAIFPKENWPSGISVNGHILLDGEKMSKSKGNFITFRDAISSYGVDASRFAMAFAGDVSITDANFDTKLVSTLNTRFFSMIEFAKNNYNKGTSRMRNIDIWFENKIDETVNKVDELYSNSQTRTALQCLYYDLNNDFKWYTKRTKGEYNREVINKFIEYQNLMLSPVIPHICEEVWEIIGKKEFVSQASWPTIKDVKKDDTVEKENEIISNIFAKVNKQREVKNIEKLKIITIIKPSKTKYELFNLLEEQLNKTRDFKTIFEAIREADKFNSEMKFIQKFLPKTLGSGLTTYLGEKEDERVIEEIQEFLKEEFNCDVNIISQEDNSNVMSVPGDYGIIIE